LKQEEVLYNVNKWIGIWGNLITGQFNCKGLIAFYKKAAYIGVVFIYTSKKLCPFDKQHIFCTILLRTLRYMLRLNPSLERPNHKGKQDAY